MRRVALLAAVFVASFVVFTRSQTASAATPKPIKKSNKVVVVKPGDSLSKIAKRQKTTYKRIFYANSKVKNPDLIYAGDKLRIPHKDEKLKARPVGEVAVSKPHTTTHRSYSRPQQSSYQYRPVAVAPSANVNGGVWDRLAACESGGNWAINTGNGYFGGLQFTLASWRGVGGQGYPHQASKAEQIARGKMLQARQGWGAWPACTAKLGIR